MEENVLFHVTVPKVFQKEVPVQDGEGTGVTDKTAETPRFVKRTQANVVDMFSVDQLELGQGKKVLKKTVTLHPGEIVERFLFNVGITDYTVQEFHRSHLIKNESDDSIKEESEGENESKPSIEGASVSSADEESIDAEAEDGLGKEPSRKFMSQDDIKLDDTNLPLQKMIPDDEPSVVFIFSVGSNLAEKYLLRLETLGVGYEDGFGTVNIIPCFMSRSAKKQKPESLRRASVTNADQADLSDGVEGSISDGDDQEAKPKKDPIGLKKMRVELMETIKSRVAIDNVVKLVNSGAEFSFDFVMLVIVASVLAAVGLVTNNVVVIVASMLVSPIMGPILAITFGATIHDHAMVKKGSVSEFVALLMCVFIGFLVGLGGAKPTYNNAVEDGTEWPAFEMVSRGTTAALLAGIPVAFFSGIGVALSVLGNNTTSLVGVAISASLLPPAVNTGVLLGYATVIGAIRTGIDTDPDVIYEDTKDLLVFGALSLCLTLLNIALIIVAGIGMFHLKEVTPIKGKTDFWAKHVQHARNYNTIVKHDAATESLLRNVKNALKNKDPYASQVRFDLFSADQDLKNDEGPQNVLSEALFVDPNGENSQEQKTEESTKNPSKGANSLLNLFVPLSHKKKHHHKHPEEKHLTKEDFRTELKRMASANDLNLSDTTSPHRSYGQTVNEHKLEQWNFLRRKGRSIDINDANN
mmetsp:Transcript_2893/g.3915  ORF Transcript_2893/g.3915 Transcript_2893/m.3915 type:complete len:696 (+) Transcript_2893:103-2190(+)